MDSFFRTHTIFKCFLTAFVIRKLWLGRPKKEFNGWMDGWMEDDDDDDDDADADVDADAADDDDDDDDDDYDK